MLDQYWWEFVYKWNICFCFPLKFRSNSYLLFMIFRDYWMLISAPLESEEPVHVGRTWHLIPARLSAIVADIPVLKSIGYRHSTGSLEITAERLEIGLESLQLTNKQLIDLQPAIWSDNPEHLSVMSFTNTGVNHFFGAKSSQIS